MEALLVMEVVHNMLDHRPHMAQVVIINQLTSIQEIQAHQISIQDSVMMAALLHTHHRVDQVSSGFFALLIYFRMMKMLSKNILFSLE
jgi:hypothetical protein